MLIIENLNDRMELFSISKEIEHIPFFEYMICFKERMAWSWINLLKLTSQGRIQHCVIKSLTSVLSRLSLFTTSFGISFRFITYSH